MPALTSSRPADPYADTKLRLAHAVERARDEIIDLSHRIHADPEPAFEEHHAAAWVAAALARHGYAVEHPAGSLATASEAVQRGGAVATVRGSPSSPMRRPAQAGSRLRPTRWPRPV